MQRPPTQARRHAPTLLLLIVHKCIITSLQRPSALPAVHATRRTRRVLVPATAAAGAVAAPTTELENVYRIVRAAHCQQGADNVEVERVYASLTRATPELVQLLRARDAPHADDGALIRGSRKKRAGAVQC